MEKYTEYRRNGEEYRRNIRVALKSLLKIGVI